jgi:hypothetical protein
MSEKDVNKAVEKILGDPAFAKKVYEKPEETLTGSFDLLPGEWTSIAWCLQRDIENAMAQKNTLSEGFFKSVDYQLISQVPKLQGVFDRYAAGPTAVPGFALKRQRK